MPEAQIEEIAGSFEELQLAQSLRFGIGFIYEGMLERDREAVEALYKAGAIQVLISTYKLCWELNLHA